MSIAFVPRRVSKKPSKAPSKSAAQSLPVLADVSSEQDSSSKSITSQQDLVALVNLALSNHALWKEPGLRRLLQENEEMCACSRSSSGSKYLTVMIVL